MLLFRHLSLAIFVVMLMLILLMMSTIALAVNTTSSSSSTSSSSRKTSKNIDSMTVNATTTIVVTHGFDNTNTNTNKSNNIPTKFLGIDVHGKPVFVPLVGAGTWQYDDDDAYQSLCQAFAAGYTFVDTAWGYNNSKGVGRAINDCWQDRPRTDLFVMTKIPGGLNTSQVEEAHSRNLLDLGLDYVDHLMVHYPADWDGTVASQSARQEEWLALEAIYYRGEARSIGVSHYCTRHIIDIMWVATITPSINQVEYHVGSQDVDDVMDTCSDFGITFMSFSPLCGPCHYEPVDSLVDGALVTDIASKYENVTGSQVALRYIVQQGIPVIPKSKTMAHIMSNINIFHFELSQDHMERLARATRPAAEAGDCDVATFRNERKTV